MINLKIKFQIFYTLFTVEELQKIGVKSALLTEEEKKK
jgi:hypothetical protein